MILFKILQEFLLPSVFVFLLILAGLILLLKRKQKSGKILIILGVFLYCLFSISPISDLILFPLEKQYQPIQQNELDKANRLVLLLGGRESDVLRASEALRVYTANSQFPISNFQIIVSGTDSLNPQRKEAREVKEFLTERGIPAENIVLEDKSRNTAESAENIKGIIGNEPFFLVTSAYHMPRSMEVFQKMGTYPIPAPADFKIEKDYDILDFFPNAQNLKNTDSAFHEYFGILWYRLKY